MSHLNQEMIDCHHSFQVNGDVIIYKGRPYHASEWEEILNRYKTAEGKAAQQIDDLTFHRRCWLQMRAMLWVLVLLGSSVFIAVQPICTNQNCTNWITINLICLIMAVLIHFPITNSIKKKSQEIEEIEPILQKFHANVLEYQFYV